MDFLFILGAHWIGDYLLQTTRMATEKKHSFVWLGWHTLTYTAVLTAFSLALFPPEAGFKFILFNGLIHGITDLFTSRWAARYLDEPRIFFPILGFDQFLHLAALYSSYHYFFAV